MSRKPRAHDEKLALARVALNDQDYTSAEKYYRNYIAMNPNDLEAEMELGIASLLGGDGSQFAETYNRLAQDLEERKWPSNRVQRLWCTFERLSVSVRHVVAVTSMAALPLGAVACAEDPPSQPAVQPSLPTPQSPTVPDAAPDPASPSELIPPVTPPLGPLLGHDAQPEDGALPNRPTMPKPPNPALVVPTPGPQPAEVPRPAYRVVRPAYQVVGPQEPPPLTPRPRYRVPLPEKRLRYRVILPESRDF